jgi:hypothetical protein
MLNITTTHVLQCPNGRWSFVGLVPGRLCRQQPATQADVMAGRAYKNTDGLMTSKVLVFDTEQEARQFAASQGVTLAN